jgi:hypothetical protein
MLTFRKKPVEVSAWPLMTAGRDEHGREIMRIAWPEWVSGALASGRMQFVYAKDGARERIVGATIATLEGEMRADLGDWVIRGVTGEIYPCKPDIFEATYEQVTPPVPPGMDTTKLRQGVPYRAD